SGFKIRTEDSLLVVLVLAWLGRLGMGLQKHFLIKTPVNLPIFLIIIWNVISSWRAISAGMMADSGFCILTNLKLIEFFVVYFLVANNLNNIKEVKIMFYLLFIIALVVGLYTILQIPKTAVFTTNRLSAPFESTPEPNTLGALLVMFFGMALSIVLYAKASLLKKICVVLVIILPLSIMFSYARSAYLAFIAMVIVLTLVSRRKWLVSVVLISVLLSPFILPKSVINRALYNFQDPRYFGFLDPSAAERVFVYQKAGYHIKQYPFLGGGVATGGGVLDSQYARVVMEGGLVGLALFIWLLLRLIKMGVRLFRSVSDGWIKGAALGFITVVIGLIVHSWGNITFYIIRIAEPFWALAALIAYLLYYVTIEKERLQIANSDKISIA
ncbi:MAG: O-antigen ligase family protein, partial [Candidatus Omnitrophica bacterium]|nr:O-antigen ligase family protein [Candidatus Omnitrophota bacterium]